MKFRVYLFTVTLIFFFTSCGNDDAIEIIEPFEPVLDKNLFGAWQNNNHSDNVYGSYYFNTLEFSPNGNILVQDFFGNFYGYGEWCVNNNTIYLNIGSIENTLRYSISNEQLVFEAHEDFIAQDWYDCCGGWTKIN